MKARHHSVYGNKIKKEKAMSKSLFIRVHQSVLIQTFFTFDLDSCTLKTQNNYHTKGNTSDALNPELLPYSERVKQTDLS